MSIKIRLFIIMIIICILYSIGLVSSRFLVNRIITEIKDIYTVRLIGINYLFQADRDACNSHLALGNTLKNEIYNNRDKLNKEFKSVDYNLNITKSEFKEFEKLYKTIIAEKLFSEKISAFNENFDKWSKNTDEIKKLINEKNINAASDIYFNEYRENYNNMKEIINFLSKNLLIEASEKYDKIENIKKHSLIATAANTIVVIIIFIIITLISLKFLLNPINKVNLRLKEITEGEGDLTKTITATSKDAIGNLSQSFNLFIEKLRMIIIKIKNSSQKNVIIRDDLSASSEETLAALTEITANIESLNDQFINLNTNISNSSTSLEQISKNIESLDAQIEGQTSAVTESSAAVTEMIASIDNVAEISKRKKDSTDKLVETAKKGGEKINTTNTIIENITKKVDDMLEMIDIINQVASQTDLLSMNAAIEAAHAGEAGKSFAVVADEIRKLAESTSESAKSISNVLQDVVDNIKNAADASKESQNAFEEINKEIKDVALALDEVTSSANELSTGGSQIIEAMTMLSDNSAKVKEGSEEMKTGTIEITNSIQNVNDISLEFQNGLNEILAGIREITMSMNNLSKLSGELGEVSEKLDNEINKFKTGDDEVEVKDIDIKEQINVEDEMTVLQEDERIEDTNEDNDEDEELK